MALDLSLCRDLVLPELRKRSPLFGDWKMRYFLGAGGFAYVFLLGHQSKPLPPVALKVVPLLPEITNGKYRLDQALFASVQEISRYVELGTHSNLVGMHNYEVIRNVGPSKGALLLIMTDYYPNTLNALLTESVLSEERTASILLQCLSGLEYMHKLEIVHRDIKPGNIFLDADGLALIGDFGISLSLRQSFSRKRYAGTLGYMPPEACNGRNDAADPYQLDLYALAVSGYKMLEGVLPYQRECANFKEVLRCRLAGKPITFSWDGGSALQSILLKALRLDPAARFPTAASFRMALEPLAFATVEAR